MDGDISSTEVIILFDGGSHPNIFAKTRKMPDLKTEVNFVVHAKNGERFDAEAL